MFTIFSCSQTNQCGQSTESAVNIKLLKNSNHEIEDTMTYKLSVFGLNHSDTLINNMLYNDSLDVTNIRLPLAPDINECRFVLIFDSVPERVLSTDTFVRYHLYIDTLTFIYSEKLKLISPECGFTYEFRLNQNATTHHAIDSIAIIQPVITGGNEENLEIFL